MTTDTDTGQPRLLQVVWEEAVGEVERIRQELGGFSLLKPDYADYQAACDRERRAGRLYLAALRHHEPSENAPPIDQERAWARALGDIGAILDQYAGGPSPRHASAALLAIKTIVEEVVGREQGRASARINDPEGCEE
jgi:hypothetical protein